MRLQQTPPLLLPAQIIRTPEGAGVKYEYVFSLPSFLHLIVPPDSAKNSSVKFLATNGNATPSGSLAVTRIKAFSVKENVLS